MWPNPGSPRAAANRKAPGQRPPGGGADGGVEVRARRSRAPPTAAIFTPGRASVRRGGDQALGAMLGLGEGLASVPSFRQPASGREPSWGPCFEGPRGGQARSARAPAAGAVGAGGRRRRDPDCRGAGLGEGRAAACVGRGRRWSGAAARVPRPGLSPCGTALRPRAGRTGGRPPVPPPPRAGPSAPAASGPLSGPARRAPAVPGAPLALGFCLRSPAAEGHRAGHGRRRGGCGGRRFSADLRQRVSGGSGGPGVQGPRPGASGVCGDSGAAVRPGKGRRVLPGFVERVPCAGPAVGPVRRLRGQRPPR